ncbi:TPA: hypothetical protein SML68_004864 [Serratia marcescens]|nr:hypothetical protein [Serratia marcescens]HEJ9068662.1 hypothetical protein [Serratia marcescens]HEJ9105343.1 hypothetical protein [Serratia marcescens]HEJ9108856.1 hypothetical protein [Serratia marcescens]
MVQRLAEKMHKLDFDDEVTGLIYGHVFRSGEPPARLNSQQVCQAYQALPSGDGFVWLHLNLNHAAAEKWLKNHFAISDLGRMRRMLLRFQRLLAPEPAALFRLLNRPPAWLSREVVQDLRQFTEEFTVVLNDLASLTERIRLLQEELGAKLMEQNNRTLYTLTVITVLALPINIVAGFFGMNVGGIPLASNHHGFILLVLLVGSFTLIAGYLAFRRRDES